MEYLLPALILLLLVYALLRGVDLYDAFVQGAAEALPLIVKILPYMAVMMAALSILRASGAMELITRLVAPLCRLVGMPEGLVPLFVLRPFSGSAAMGLLADVYAAYGPDSFEGLAASVMLGSTETIFYVLAVYFGSVNIAKTRYAVPVSLFAGLVGAVAALVFTRWIVI